MRLHGTAIATIYALSLGIESRTLQTWERSSGLNKIQIAPNGCSNNTRQKYKEHEELNSPFSVANIFFFQFALHFIIPRVVFFFNQTLTAEGAGSFVVVLSCWAALCKGSVFNLVSGIN